MYPVLGQRLLIVESDAGQLPPLYTEVADEQSRSVGKIVDLYGSVFKTVSDCVMQHRFVCRCACRRQTVCHRRKPGRKNPEKLHLTNMAAICAQIGVNP